MTMMRPLVIGLGNEFRGDDAIGVEILKGMKNFAGVDTYHLRGDGTLLLPLWQHRHVVIVDAIKAEPAKSGEIVFLHPDEDELAHWPLTSSHGVSLAEAWRLAKILDQKPLSIMIIGICGHQFEQGLPLSVGLCEQLPSIIDSVGTAICERYLSGDH